MTTKETVAELKPVDCPFCGASAILENGFGYWIQCTDLDCDSTDGTVHSIPRSAVEHWNRRDPAVAALQSEIAALQQLVKMCRDALGSCRVLVGQPCTTTQRHWFDEQLVKVALAATAPKGK